MESNPQVRINPGNTCVDQSLRQWIEPPIGLPFLRIPTPQLRIYVGIQDTQMDFRPFRKRELVDVLAIDAFNRLRKRENGVLTSPGGSLRQHGPHQRLSGLTLSYG